jgi:hypothetical protein
MKINEADEFRPGKHFWSPGAGRTEADFVCSLCEKFYDIYMLYQFSLLKNEFQKPKKLEESL